MLRPCCDSIKQQTSSSWLSLTSSAALQPASDRIKNARSRGALPVDFLNSSLTPIEYLKKVQPEVRMLWQDRFNHTVVSLTYPAFVPLAAVSILLYFLLFTLNSATLTCEVDYHTKCAVRMTHATVVCIMYSNCIPY